MEEWGVVYVVVIARVTGWEKLKFGLLFEFLRYLIPNENPPRAD